MITNERQHRITKSKADRFRSSLSSLLPNLNPNDALQVAQRDALQSQLDQLESEIAAYEALRSGQKRVLEVNSLDQLPQVLVQARTAAGFSQRELAERLGLKEQQIQRYESTLYSSVSLDRLLKLIRILGIELPNEVILNADRASVEAALSRAEEAGLPRNFIRNRLLPESLAAGTSSPGYQPGLLGVLVRRLERLYGWTAEALLTGSNLRLPQTAFVGLAYKTPKNSSEKKLAAYTVYAHYLALVALDTVEVPSRQMPANPAELRRDVEATYGRFSLAATLRYSWDHGVAVLPLRDKGTFHGACWKAAGKSVIVLKQKTHSNARWLFDLLHEIRHTQQHANEESYAIVEAEDAAKGHSTDDEIDANRYAGNAVLENQAEELASACVEQASGNIRFLKNAATRVAAQENVDLAQLANYLAFRLNLQGENWWGAAANLQPKDENPWEIARDVFLERANLARIGAFDRDLLARALKF